MLNNAVANGNNNASGTFNLAAATTGGTAAGMTAGLPAGAGTGTGVGVGTINIVDEMARKVGLPFS